jgi:YbbR domain-containing protein
MAVFLIFLLVAALFWTITALNKVYIVTAKIPLHYKNVPFNFSKVKQLSETISVDIEARGFDLMNNKFSKNNQEVVIDLNAPFFRNAELNKRISFSSERLLREFIAFSDNTYRIVKASPDSIIFDYTRKFTKKIPVKLNAEVLLKKQYQTASAILKPDSVEISGDENELKNISAIETEKISFKNADKDLFFSLKLINAFKGDVAISHSFVWVMIPVQQFTEGKLTVNIEKVYYNNKPVTLIPQNVVIKYHASFADFSTIGSDDFKIEIDEPENSIRNNENKLIVKLTRSPKAARIVSITPEIADYIIEQ